MRQPEMTHSPAYYQDHAHLMTTSLHDPSTTPAVPSAAHHPDFSSDSTRSKQGAAVYSPSELNPAEGASSNVFPSDSWDVSDRPQVPQEPYRLPHHYQQQQVPGESIYPDPESSAAAPVSVPSSRRGNGSASTPASYSNGVSRKEERVRGSWTDHSSSMSGDNHHHSAPRVHKRPIHDEEPLAYDSQDALLMLVSFLFQSCLPFHREGDSFTPLLIFCEMLVVPTLAAGTSIFSMCIAIHRLRLILCPPHHPLSPLLLHSIPSNHIVSRAAMRSSSSAVAYP